MFKKLIRFKYSVEVKADLVKFDYNDLINPQKDLSDLIDKAYSLDGLGIAIIKNIPNYMQLREKVLKYGYTMYKISDRMEKYKWNDYNLEIGWAVRSSLSDNNTEYDIQHGAFSTKTRFKSRGSDNYPQEPELEGFQEYHEQMRNLFTFLIKSKLKHFDKYLHLNNPKIPSTFFQDYLKHHESQEELLTYFPFNSIPEERREYYRKSLPWIGWHRDYSCFTCLSRAQYFDTEGNKIQGIPVGLIVKNRHGQEFKVDFEEGEIAMQIGDVAYVLIGGLINSTPHKVEILGNVPDNVLRATFVQFLDPLQDSIVKPPEGVTLEEVLKKDPLKQEHTMLKTFTSGVPFKEFGKTTYNEI